MYRQLVRKLCPGKHHHSIDFIAEINAVIGGLAAYPQLIRALTTHDVQGLEPIMFWILTVTSIVWVAYGIHRRSIPVIISSTLTAIASGWILALLFLWSK